MTSYIEEFIKKSAGRLIKVINFEAEVVSVDKTKDTIVVKPAEGDDIPDVKLKSILSNNTKKIVLYPAEGSFVTVSLLRNSEVDFYVTGYSEVEEAVINCDNIVINGGANGGLVNWSSVKEQLDKTNEVVQALVNSLTGWTPVANDGGAALQIYANGQLAGKSVGNYADKEDTKVKH
jgi:hypothetical protein